MEKNGKSLDDDDERKNLCWSPFSCSSPLHLASLALALLALAPLAFAPLHLPLPCTPLKTKMAKHELKQQAKMAKRDLKWQKVS